MENSTNNTENQTNVNVQTQDEIVNYQAKIRKATLIIGDKRHDFSFKHLIELPSATAASAVSEMRSILKKNVQPKAVSKLADEIVTMMEDKDKVTMKTVLKKFAPLLMGSELQDRLYGNTIDVDGDEFVVDMIKKEIKGVSVHLAVLMESVKEEPALMMKLMPLFLGGDDAKAENSGNQNGNNTSRI